MAEKRMFAKTIIDSDAFLDMPLSTQSLYFHLSMRADDDGFVNNPKKIQRMVGASDDDFKILVAKSFIICFETGVIVIKHWLIHNYIRKDRKQDTKYQEEFSRLLVKDNGAYTLDSAAEIAEPLLLTGNCQACDSQMSGMCHTENRLDKDRLDKNKISIGECEGGKKKKNKSRIKETDNPMFNRFYEAYPKHISGDYARKCFERIDPDEELLGTMLAAIERQKKTEQWQNIRYIPNPSTWLNERKWTDEIPDDYLVGHSQKKQWNPNQPKSHYKPDGSYDYEAGQSKELESF